MQFKVIVTFDMDPDAWTLAHGDTDALVIERKIIDDLTECARHAFEAPQWQELAGTVRHIDVYRSM